MLHKSFKPAKCKTSLKLASSRIKLMKNKKGVQINQIKRDLAQLLETGQDRTARIRVEHAIREEKMVAAYELIEIYCELIVARLPIIESQKTCPIDLKEAVTSVIFAAPRCSDIPELVDIRKHFTAKYGKEFISAAIELRPECGVSRMLVEKLSAVAPNVETKVKVLNAVAKEYNINWDPTSFEEKESKPPDDLLNGPVNFEKASMKNADPQIHQASNVHTVHGYEEKQNAPVDFSEQNRRYTQNSTYSDTGGVETPSASNHAHMDSSGQASERMKVRQSFDSNGDDFSSGRPDWNMEFKDATSAAQAAAESAERASMAARAAAHLSSQGKIRNERPQMSANSDFHGQRYSKDTYRSSFDDRKKSPATDQHMDQREHDSSPEKRSSNDLTESIRDESSQVSATSDFRGQRYSKDSYRSSFDDRKMSPARDQHMDQRENDLSPEKRSSNYLNESIRDESSQVSATSDFHGQRHFRDSNRSSIIDRKSEVQNQQMDQREHDSSPERFYQDNHGGIQSSNRQSSIESRNDLYEDETVNNLHNPDGYFQEPSHRNQENLSSPEDINYFAEEAVKKQSNIIAGEHDGSKQKRTVVGNPFAVVDQGNIFSQTSKTSSYVDASNSDDDGPKFDTGFEYDEGESKSFFPSPGRESSIPPFENTNLSSPRRNTSNTIDQIFSERRSFSGHSIKSVDPSETDNHMPVSFDHSDGPDSESETDLAKSNFKGINESISPRKSRIELNDLVERAQSYEPLEVNTDFPNESNDLDTGKELNFGTLTGGLRNKGGHRYPPYTKKSTEESSVTVDQTPLQKSFKSKVSRMENKKPNVLISSSESDSDDYGDKIKETKIRSQFSPPVAFFDDDSDEEVVLATKQTSTNRVQLGSGLSRRTKGSPSAPYTKSHIEPVGRTVISTLNNDRKPSEPRAHAGSSVQIPESPFMKREESLKSQAVDQPVSPSRMAAERKPTRRPHSNESPAESRSYVGTSKKEPNQIPELPFLKREESLKSQDVDQPVIPSRMSAERKPTRRNYINESPAEPHSYTGTSKKEEPKQIPELPFLKREESLKSQAADQPVIPSRMTAERKPTRRNYINESPAEPHSYTGMSKKEDPKQIPESPLSKREESLKSQGVEQPFTRKTAVREHMRGSYTKETPPEPQATFDTMPTREERVKSRPVDQRQGQTETSKSTKLSLETSSGENIVKKPSHVHPKLPDYDSLAARLQSLRTDRQ